jgi:hypothetical protein
MENDGETEVALSQQARRVFRWVIAKPAAESGAGIETNKRFNHKAFEDVRKELLDLSQCC